MPFGNFGFDINRAEEEYEVWYNKLVRSSFCSAICLILVEANNLGVVLHPFGQLAQKVTDEDNLFNDRYVGENVEELAEDDKGTVEYHYTPCVPLQSDALVPK